MKKGCLDIIAFTSVMLVVILLHEIRTAALGGISVYLVTVAALAIAYAVARKIKKREIDISSNKMIFLSLTMVLVSYVSATYAPYLLALVIISVSMGIHYRYFMHTLAKTVQHQEGI